MTTNLSVFSNTAVQLFAKAITVLSNIFVMILILRGYGVAGAGEYTKALSYVAVFYFLCDFGLNAIAVRLATEEKNTTVFSHLLVVRTVGSLILVFIALAILPFLPYDVSTGIGYSPLTMGAIILLIPTIILYGLQLSTNAIFQFTMRYDKAAISTIIGTLTSLALFYIAVTFQWPFVVAMIAYGVGYGVMAFVSLLLARISITIPSREQWTRLLFGAFPLGTILFINFIYSKADIFILTGYRSTEEVGYYGLAYRVFEVLLTIPTFFANSFYPVLLGLISSKSTDLHQHLTKYSKLLLGSAVGIGILSFVFQDYLTFIDPAFAQAIPLFRILIFSLPFFFLSSLYQWVLIATKQYGLLLLIYAIAMTLGVSMNLFFVPRYGAMASALITCAVEIIVFFSTYYLSKQFLQHHKPHGTV